MSNRIALVSTLALAAALLAVWVAWRWRHPVRPLVLTIVLNAAALGLPLGYTAWVLIPAACFAIAVSVATASRRRAWLQGTAACPWFLVPYLVWYAVTASPDQVAAYGRVPWPFVGVAMGCGGIGASLGATLRWFLGPDPTAENARPGAAEG